MKRKDWISTLALLLILGIAFIGEQFRSNGLWGDAAINLSLVLLPLLVFYIVAVVARNRKGSYVKFWRMLSYVCIAIAVFFLFAISVPFMHYFNVQNRQNKVKEKVGMIIADCDKMLSEYDEQVKHRYTTYNSDLQSAVNERKWNVLDNAIPGADPHAPNFVTSTSDSWKVNMFAHHSEMKKNWTNLKPLFQKALIDEFDVFTAAKQVNELVKQYNDFKEKLTEDFERMTPLEKKYKTFGNDVPQFKFENKEKEWRDSVAKLFTETKMHVGMFIIFFILALFACSGYIFFKDNTVRTPRSRKNAEVYELGHKL